MEAHSKDSSYLYFERILKLLDNPETRKNGLWQLDRLFQVPDAIYNQELYN